MQRALTKYIPKSLISFDGSKIYYEIAKGINKKPTLLFIHGIGGDLTAWDQERLFFQQKEYATVALDLRGHGLSQRSTKINFYSLDNFARDIITLCERERLQDVIIIGHCFGGIISLITLGKYNMPAKGLVLVDTSYKPPHIGTLTVDTLLLQIIASLLSKLPFNIGLSGHVDFRKYIGTGDFDKKRLLSDILHTSLKSYFVIFSNYLKFDGITLLKKIVVPTLIIQGEEDSIFPPEIAEILHEKIISSEYEIIPKANHIIVLNNPIELSQAIYPFVQKL